MNGRARMAARLPDRPHRVAELALAKADPLMRQLIRRIGPCTLVVDGKKQPYETLVRAVAYQQLHAKAAEAILKRFTALFDGRFPKPAALLAADPAALRNCGFSQSKIAAIRDIAHHAQTGLVPTRARIARLPDEEIIERLTQIRGVGRWTVEMLLIFQLGRPDVLPVDDFGVRNGFRLAAQLPEMPKPRTLRDYGQRWQPYRTIASWYLWRAVECYANKPNP